MSVWIIDSNIPAYWIIHKRVLDIFIQHDHLHAQFKTIYENRYSDAITLLNKLLTKQEDVYVFEFGINEVISTIRDEAKTILMFSKGIPLSRWPEEKRKITIAETLVYATYQSFLKELDYLFFNSKTNFQLLATTELSSANEYLDVYSSLLFMIQDMTTQDAVLLTSAIFQKADYFVTEDHRLVENCKRYDFQKHFGFEVMKAATGIIYCNSK